MMVAAGVVRALVGHHGHGSVRATAGIICVGFIDLAMSFDHLRRVLPHLVLVLLVVEGHAHQGLAEGVPVGGIEVQGSCSDWPSPRRWRRFSSPPTVPHLAGGGLPLLAHCGVPRGTGR